jgi:hypothetical protein
LTFGNAEDLARCEDVDLVAVTVKVPHHGELIRPAVEAGKIVLSEWPLGVDLAEAEQLAGYRGSRRLSGDGEGAASLRGRVRTHLTVSGWSLRRPNKLGVPRFSGSCGGPTG